MEMDNQANKDLDSIPEVCKGCWENDCCELKPDMWNCEEESES